VSDSNAGAGDFRGSKEEKRQDETVMINSDNLSDMVSEAKTPSASSSAGADDELADSNLGRILVIVGIIALLVAVAIITYVNVIQN